MVSLLVVDTARPVQRPRPAVIVADSQRVLVKRQAAKHDLTRWLPPVRTLLLPLVQPDGAALEPVVRSGQEVARFERLARPGTDAGCELRSPCKARVLGQTKVTTLRHHAVPALELRCEPHDELSDAPPAQPPDLPQDLESLCRLATECGLVDLSSGEPLACALGQAGRHGTCHLVINALDPLPEVAWRADLLHLAGRPLSLAAVAVARALQGRSVILAVDRAARAVPPASLVAVRGLRRIKLANRYPLAHPRMLARRLFGDRFAYDRPLAAGGVLVLDVETLFALAEALEGRQPFVWRWVFVGGDAIAQPGPYRVFLGSRLGDLMADVGVVSHVSAVVAGGLLAGQAVESPDTVVAWDTTAVHFLSAAAVSRREPATCVRCGWCIESCPVGLDPRAIYAQLGQPESPVRPELHAGACIECGLCSYVCPAELELMPGVLAAKRLAPATLAATPAGNRR